MSDQHEHDMSGVGDDIKMRAGCVATTASGKVLLLDDYDDVRSRWQNAESMTDILDFTTFVPADHAGKRLPQRFSILAGAIYALEEWGTEFAELMEEEHLKQAEAHRLPGGVHLFDLGFRGGGGQ